MSTNINFFIKKIVSFLVLFLIAYVLNFVLFYFLPKIGVDFATKNDIDLEYKRYNGFYSNVEIEEKEKNIPKEDVANLTDYKLKGIYSKSDNTGWIIIEDKDSKSHILQHNEAINGYKLIELFSKYVFFEKYGKEYKLDLTTQSTNVSYAIVQKNNSIEENIVVNNDSTVVNRDYLNSYVNDIDKIWNNISINEIREGNKITGFKIFGVKKGSAFEKLGLKKGDVIKTINDNALDSYAKAFKAYNNINGTKYLNIEILRNNEIVEFNYEIK